MLSECGQTCPKNLEELKDIIKGELSSISSTKLVDLCHYMPSRLKAMIENNGGHTHWCIYNISIWKIFKPPNFIFM